MKHRLLVALVLFMTATVSFGQIVAVPDTRPAPRPEAPRLTDLCVRPAGAAEAALDYSLMPQLLDQTPGNAATLYYLGASIMPDRKKHGQRIKQWIDTPLAELPKNQLQGVLSAYRLPLRQLELAARREDCDWGLPIWSEGIQLALPPLGKWRDLGRILLLQARLHIAEGRYDKAIHTLQTGYAMGRHVGNGPTLINGLVGVAIAAQMNKGVEELMQAPGGPNMYWALARMPRPFIPLQAAMEYEMSWLQASHAALLNKAQKRTLTPDEAGQLADALGKIWGMIHMEPWAGDQPPRTLATAIALVLYPKAKKHLAGRGYTPAQIEAMPVAQAVALYSLGRYKYWRDEMFKWYWLPYWQAHQGMRQATAAFYRARKKDPYDGWPFTAMLSGLSRAYFIAARCDRHIAGLQTIEAVRLWAAGHDGKLPAKLADIIAAPVPIDPTTGKDFIYATDGNTFTLDAPAPSGMSARFANVYKVTLNNQP